jgi:hypothetical protein
MTKTNAFENRGGKRAKVVLRVVKPFRWVAVIINIKRLPGAIGENAGPTDFVAYDVEIMLACRCLVYILQTLVDLGVYSLRFTHQYAKV